MFRFKSLFRLLAVWFGVIAILSTSPVSISAAEKLAPVPMLRDKHGPEIFVQLASIIYFGDLKFMQEV